MKDEGVQLTAEQEEQFEQLQSDLTFAGYALDTPWKNAMNQIVSLDNFAKVLRNEQTAFYEHAKGQLAIYRQLTAAKQEQLDAMDEAVNHTKGMAIGGWLAVVALGVGAFFAAPIPPLCAGLAIAAGAAAGASGVFTYESCTDHTKRKEYEQAWKKHKEKEEILEKAVCASEHVKKLLGDFVQVCARMKSLMEKSKKAQEELRFSAIPELIQEIQ